MRGCKSSENDLFYQIHLAAAEVIGYQPPFLLITAVYQRKGYVVCIQIFILGKVLALVLAVENLEFFFEQRLQGVLFDTLFRCEVNKLVINWDSDVSELRSLDKITQLI